MFAVAGLPLLLFCVAELTLRVAGFGYPTSFLLTESHDGKKWFVQNNQFGWRFFGPRLARMPDPIAVPVNKPTGTIRIFVFGESAAKGEPQPAFGMPRLLLAVLSLRHPDVRFEVVNAAMTAINSHAILPIARDCAKANGDIWVIYMGNNEVVGPFGAGTVFGRQGLPLPFIRASLALKSTRIGQGLDSILSRTQRQVSDDGEWHGMKMFLDQQLTASDPRIGTVHQQFERNLTDILRTGQRSGAGIVLSTVAVNLRDCAPFASAHRAGLLANDQTQFEEHIRHGIHAEVEGHVGEAAREFDLAARMDGDFGELRFRQGECALALGRSTEAREFFRTARDLDTLRFRCDGQLNEIIRRTATNFANAGVLLADAEEAFAAHSTNGVPGDELFYDHVHPTFAGNYLLALTLAEQVEKLLPERLRREGAAPTWPSEAACAKWLGWTEWSELAARRAVAERLRAEPFTGQLNHEKNLAKLSARIAELSSRLTSNGVTIARQACDAALKVSPDDPVLLGQLASLMQLSGNLDGAAAVARRLIQLNPSDPQAWLRLGLVLSRQNKLEDSISAFGRAIELDPMDILHRQNLGQALWQLGRRPEAIAQFDEAVKIQPRFAVGWLNLGQVLEESGRKPEAHDCFDKALRCGAARATDSVVLARFARGRGWIEAAATNFLAATIASPDDPSLRLEAAQVLLMCERPTAAEREAAEAVRLSPDSAAARRLYGLILGQLGRNGEAEVQFRAALQLEPERVQSQLDLGMALLAQRKSAEALKEFEAALERSPTNETALRMVRGLRAQH